MHELLTPRQAAERLGVHVTTFRSWLRKGRLPAYRLGARFTRVSWQEVLSALAVNDFAEAEAPAPSPTTDEVPRREAGEASRG